MSTTSLNDVELYVVEFLDKMQYPCRVTMGELTSHLNKKFQISPSSLTREIVRKVVYSRTDLIVRRGIGVQKHNT